jgi:hypothetical protein
LRGAGSLIEDRTPRLGTRRREREPERLGNALPAVLEAELARLPLSMLWLPQSRPSTITSSFVDVR